MKISEIRVSYTNRVINRVKVCSSRESYKILYENWNISTIELLEEFKVLMMNRNNEVLGIYSHSKGGVSGTIVDPKLIFSVALKCNSSAIIIAHNHPSGNLNPSQADKDITRRVADASRLLDIKLFDHLIITKESFFSFSDEGLM